MALVRNIEPTTKNSKAHGEVACFSSSFADKEGNRYLQLDTTGSPLREASGRTSQSVQFDERAASQLKSLIEETFPNLKERS